jgi:hypothetical protein
MCINKGLAQMQTASATIIQFPRQMPAERPWFGDWLTDQVGGRWVVRKQRRRTWRGIDQSDRVQLLDREYLAYLAKYEAQFGPVYG